MTATATEASVHGLEASFGIQSRDADPVRLADRLDALAAPARQGDPAARAELQAAHRRAMNPTGPEDGPWQVAWMIHMDRGRPRRERQSQRYRARVRIVYTCAAIRERMASHSIVGVAPRPRGAGRPRARRIASRTGDSGDDSGEPGESDLARRGRALRRSRAHARGPPVSDPSHYSTADDNGRGP